MAEVDAAVKFVLLQEDRELSGVVTDTKGDPGGITRYGIASKWHRDLVPIGFFDPLEMDRDTALALATKVYTRQYAPPLELERISSQDLANRLLSFAVNEGQAEAVKLLQKALQAAGWRNVAADSVFGPRTLTAVNQVDPAALLAQWRNLQKVYYAEWVAEMPAERGGLLQGLLNRAAA